MQMAIKRYTYKLFYCSNKNIHIFKIHIFLNIIERLACVCFQVFLLHRSEKTFIMLKYYFIFVWIFTFKAGAAQP